MILISNPVARSLSNSALVGLLPPVWSSSSYSSSSSSRINGSSSSRCSIHRVVVGGSIIGVSSSSCGSR